MRNLIIGLLAGLFIGLVLAGNVAVATAQAPMRVYGTGATGQPVPIGVVDDALKVSCS